MYDANPTNSQTQGTSRHSGIVNLVIRAIAAVRAEITFQREGYQGILRKLFPDYHPNLDMIELPRTLITPEGLAACVGYMNETQVRSETGLPELQRTLITPEKQAAYAAFMRDTQAKPGQEPRRTP